MQNISRNVMNAIKMNRVELLVIVRENMAKHVAEYLEAVEDYKKLVLQLATANLKMAKTQELAEFAKIKAVPSKPNSYEASYKRAVRMLELSIEDVIEIEEDVFNQLVLDEWSWKNSFITSNSLYKAGAAF
jgi:hypothetical protein